MAEIDEVIEQHGGWPGAQPTAESADEGQTLPDSIGKAGGTPVSPKPSTIRPAATPAAPSRPVAPDSFVRDEESKSILVALDNAGEALGIPLLCLKTKIDRRRLEECLPILVRQGVLRQSGTGSSARYSRG